MSGGEYYQSLNEIVDRLTPERLSEGLLSVPGLGIERPLDELAFVRIEPRESGTVCAIDGGSGMVLDAGVVAFGVLRTAEIRCTDGEVDGEAVSDLRFVELPGLGTDSEHHLDKVREREEAGRARACMEEMTENGLLLIDGAYNHTSADCDSLMRGSEDIARPLAWFSKSSSMHVGRLPALPFIRRMGERRIESSRWFCEIGENHRVRVTVAKLNPVSRHVFRIDMPCWVDAEGLLARLCSLASDPFYLGYPYPLARAHNLASIPRDLVRELRGGLERIAAMRGPGHAEIVSMLLNDFHIVLDEGR